MKKRKQDENLHSLAADPDFKVEQIPVGEPGSTGEENTSPPRKGKGIAVLILIFLAVIFIWQRPRILKRNESVPVKMPGQSEEVVSVTEAAKEEESERQTKAEKETNLTQEPPSKEKPEETKEALIPDLSWQETIFGKEKESVMVRPISVAGLTENERNLILFRESDFIKSLSAFLTANNISSSQVSFTAPIACSAGEAAAYRADLKGITDRKLIVFFYPAYPGKYLFALESVEKSETKEDDKSRVTQNASPALTAPNVATVTAPAQTQQTQDEPKDTYDAMSLKLTGIPGELGNYLSNTYALQYALYDYLYGRGIKNADSAAVTDYYIDPDERIATIQLSLEGVGNVTAIYDHDDNTYEFG